MFSRRSSRAKRDSFAMNVVTNVEGRWLLEQQVLRYSRGAPKKDSSAYPYRLGGVIPSIGMRNWLGSTHEVFPELSRTTKAVLRIVQPRLAGCNLLLKAPSPQANSSL